MFHTASEEKASSGSCRLDRLVSGVLVLARTSSVAAQLSQHISQQLVVKEYLARVKVGTWFSFSLQNGWSSSVNLVLAGLHVMC